MTKPFSSSQCVFPTSFTSLSYSGSEYRQNIFGWKTMPLKTEAHNQVERALENKTHLKVHQRQQVKIKYFLKKSSNNEGHQSEHEGCPERISEMGKVTS